MRKLLTPDGRARAIVVKNRALRPNAARGNAVAVPRESGKLKAAIEGRLEQLQGMVEEGIAHQLLSRQ